MSQKFVKFFVAAMFIAVPSLMLHADLNARIEQGRDSVNWSNTQGEILKSKVKKHTTSKGQLVYEPYVWYKYFVNGKVYGSRVMQFSVENSNEKTEKKAKNYVLTHPVGHKMPVYYNPTNPKQATLKTGIDTVTQAIYYALNIARAVAFGFLLFFIVQIALGRESLFAKR